MAVVTANRGADGERKTENGGARDSHIRVHQVVQIHHATAPSRNSVLLLDEPETLDDCLIATGANIERYYLKAPFKWVSYEQVAACMAEARNSGSGKNYPYSREQVFAPVKVVLAEATPIRAALAFEPCYPWQAKLATRVPGQRLWMVYAAVAVLNSRIGRRYYSHLLARTQLKSTAPHGLKIPALQQIPVARADWEYEELGKVVDLTHQLIALHEGREECLPLIRQHGGTGRDRYHLAAQYEALFQRHIDAVDARLEDALRQLLGLGEAEEHALLQGGVHPPREPAQTRLFEDWDFLPPVPPPPPVKLLGGPDEVSLGGTRLGESETADEIQRLLRFWEEAINSRPPRELYEEAATERLVA